MQCLKCLKPLESNSNHYGLHRECFTGWFKADPDANFLSLTRRSVASGQKNTSSANDSFFQGKFKKYSAELDGQSYILKMRETEAPELPEVEYLCNQIAQTLNLPIADFYIVDFDGDKVFVTKNFIKKTSLSDLQHIHHYRSDELHTCEGLIATIAEQTKRPYDVGIFIDTVLYDSLIGNHDRHGRNLAFIVSSGKKILSPIYDNVSYLGLESGYMLKADHNPLGKIATKEALDPGIRDYVKEFRRLGYGDKIDEFKAKIKTINIEQLISQSFCSDAMKAAILKLFIKRYGELKSVSED